jgi:PAS domain S-box-containing protein
VANTADFWWPSVRTAHGHKCGLFRGHGHLDRLAIFHPVRDEADKIVDFVCDSAISSPLTCGSARLSDWVAELEKGSSKALSVAARAGAVSAFARAFELGKPFVRNGLRMTAGSVEAPNVQTFDVRAARLGDALVCTWQDVTEIERLKKELGLDRRILDEVEAAVVATDAQFRILHWSKGAERLYGWNAAEVEGRTTVEVLNPQFHEDASEALILMKDLGPTHGEMEVSHKDGTRFSVLSRTVSFTLDGDSSYILSVGVDARPLKRAYVKQHETSTFLSAVTNSMTEGMFALDTAGRLTFMNEAAERLFGWSATELIGETMHEVTHFEKPDGTHYPIEECPLLGVRTSGEQIRVDHDEFVRSDGTRIPVSYSSSPLRSHSGEVQGCVVVFEDITERTQEQLRAERALEKLQWVGRIRDALDQGRFVLYAQPIVDLRSYEIHQYELLIRMLSAQGEVIMPSRFLPAAEEFGLIEEIDRWVLGESVRLASAGHRVEFNLSGRSLADAGMIQTLGDALESCGAPPENLVCEITETALIRDTQKVSDFVRRLREMGCGVALDDFGSGFSGFTYLKQLPVSYLKIDAEFVTNLMSDESNRHVVRAIVSLARGFGVKTIAEGAENEETLKLLAELDVDFAQGYGISAPKPVSGVLDATLV